MGVCIALFKGVCIGVCIGWVKHAPFHEILAPNGKTHVWSGIPGPSSQKSAWQSEL